MNFYRLNLLTLNLVVGLVKFTFYEINGSLKVEVCQI